MGNNNNHHDRISILDLLRLIRVKRFYGTVEIVCEDGYPRYVKLHPTHLVSIDKAAEALLDSGESITTNRGNGPLIP